MDEYYLASLVEDDEKICNECKHLKEKIGNTWSGVFLCTKGRNIVSGDNVTCDVMRKYKSLCGINATLWEPK